MLMFSVSYVSYVHFIHIRSRMHDHACCHKLLLLLPPSSRTFWRLCILRHFDHPKDGTKRSAPSALTIHRNTVAGLCGIHAISRVLQRTVSIEDMNLAIFKVARENANRKIAD